MCVDGLFALLQVHARYIVFSYQEEKVPLISLQKLAMRETRKANPRKYFIIFCIMSANQSASAFLG
jgi:hypothetical protein